LKFNFVKGKRYFIYIFIFWDVKIRNLLGHLALQNNLTSEYIIDNKDLLKVNV